ncbi:2,3-dehydroadipyl-CoA hydratase [compost metagenome]
MDYARRIAANAPLAVQAAKELAVRAPDMGINAGLRMEQYANKFLSETEDAQEGRRAFAEKRTPTFRGQ